MIKNRKRFCEDNINKGIPIKLKSMEYSMNLEFKATLQMLVPMIIQIIIEKKNVTIIEAIKLFYTSVVYEKLEIEKTKLWHLSPLALYELLVMELNTGKIIFTVGI